MERLKIYCLRKYDGTYLRYKEENRPAVIMGTDRALAQAMADMDPSVPCEVVEFREHDPNFLEEVRRALGVVKAVWNDLPSKAQVVFRRLKRKVDSLEES